MDKLTIAALLVLSLTGCERIGSTQITYPTYHKVISPKNREAAAKFINDICLASNPKSDEEPEDMIKQATITAETLYGESILGVGIMYSDIFIPYDDLTVEEKARCDKFAKIGIR